MDKIIEIQRKYSFIVSLFRWFIESLHGTIDLLRVRENSKKVTIAYSLKFLPGSFCKPRSLYQGAYNPATNLVKWPFTEKKHIRTVLSLSDVKKKLVNQRKISMGEEFRSSKDIKSEDFPSAKDYKINLRIETQ